MFNFVQRIENFFYAIYTLGDWHEHSFILVTEDAQVMLNEAYFK